MKRKFQILTILVLIVILFGLKNTLISQDKYCLDSNEVKSLRLLINDYEFNKLILYEYKRLDSINNGIIINQKKTISNQDDIIRVKDIKINELSNKPPVIIDNSLKWYEYLGIITGGIIIGSGVTLIVK